MSSAKSLAQLQPTDIDKIIDDAVRDRVREAIDEVGFKTAMNPDEYTIWMNREKGIPDPQGADLHTECQTSDRAKKTARPICKRVQAGLSCRK